MAATSIKKVFVANRGEIAVRIIRACKAMGLETIVGVSAADRNSMAARLADRALCIGPNSPSGSYLRSDLLLHACLASGCDALHPGYGFLSERASFARDCEQAGIRFIGPTPDSIEAMGDKSNARTIATEAGVPVVPGCDLLNDVDHARAIGTAIGYPLLLKARAGGGGRGMRIVEHQQDIESAYHQASNEAKAAFGDGALYAERYVRRGRHIEVQVLGDGNGKVLHLYERDCTTQRRHQKLIEEAPSPALTTEVRRAMLEAALNLARRVNYRGAGTVEFLFDSETQEFFFLEMNTRIQVEHPVTEILTGIDLVQQQIRIAETGNLELEQEDIVCRGHVIECRINAEDPSKGFLPSPGRIKAWKSPHGEDIRVDTHCCAGDMVVPFYDSLLAKLIVGGETRAEAIDKLSNSLRIFEVDGIKTTIPFHLKAISHAAFRDGKITTRWIEEYGLTGSA
ncbi:MAG: acetyl-CoA carboxylase biotin carboxylase subunit [Rhizobiales bacterium]|nr:acetyl-CoA carboxylase biotin carboxylase subunit [Hyphomicrobiales bacterium]